MYIYTTMLLWSTHVYLHRNVCCHRKMFIWKIKIYPTDSSKLLKNKLCPFSFFHECLKIHHNECKSPPKQKNNFKTNPSSWSVYRWCVNSFQFQTKAIIINSNVNQNIVNILVPFIIRVSFQIISDIWAVVTR